MQTYETVKQILGLELEAKDLTFIQVSLRGVVVFIVSLVMVCVANKRFLAKMSAFDAILGFILASMLARAVNGSSAFFPTLGGGFVLVGIHALLAEASVRSDRFGVLVKGNACILVKEGKADRKMMAATKITEKDLLEEARLNGQVSNVKEIELATVERNGEVSVIRREGLVNGG
jgi:uncharacterized membrane protein YcaP (DUF421 family)